VSLAHGWRKARFAAGIVRYLREPLGPDDALEAVRSRVEDRDSSFLRLAEGAMLGEPRSSHGGLLGRAGWDGVRLRTSVDQDGLEATLAALRDQGVRTSLEEFKRRPSTFDRPVATRAGFRVATSGTSSGSPTRVLYDWGLLGEEADLECLLFESHGLLDVPCAFWLPALPSISGMHNLLVHMRFRHPPERWFSQLPVRRRQIPTIRYVQGAGRAAGVRVPLPEPTALADAERVARWLVATRVRAGGAVLKTFATSAVRVAEAALRRGLGLDGCTIFAGGEPLTERRSAFIASTGAAVFGRYVATETGWIGAACPRSSAPDALHLYTDRLAVIPGDAAANGAHTLLFTTISPQAGTVLLNTDIGDAGRLRARPCSCLLGRAGLDVEVSGVHGHDKLSAEGMTVPLATVSAVLDELVEEACAPPDAYQLREEEDATGASRLVIVLSPEVRIRDAELAGTILERLRGRGPAASLAATLWKDVGTIEVRRDRPQVSEGAKLKAFVRRR
jgi:hypothetical protein